MPETTPPNLADAGLEVRTRFVRNRNVLVARAAQPVGVASEELLDDGDDGADSGAARDGTSHVVWSGAAS